RQRPDAFLGDHLVGAVLPVFGGQAGAFGIAWRVHSPYGSAMHASGHRAAPGVPAPRRQLTASPSKTILMRMVAQRHESDIATGTLQAADGVALAWDCRHAGGAPTLLFAHGFGQT